jgi:hypothetical protein
VIIHPQQPRDEEQLALDRQKAQSTTQLKSGVWMLLGGAVIFAGSVLVLYGMPGSEEQPHKPEAVQAQPVSTQDHVAKRQAAQDWWGQVMAPMSVAYFALGNPGELGAKDSADLYAIVKKAGDLADRAKHAAAAGDKPQPEGWDDVSSALFFSASKLSEGCENMKKYIDDQNPSYKVEAQDASAASRQALWDAIGKARAHYVKMGGKADQIRDYGVPQP